MDRELNLPTLFSSALLLMAALLMQRLDRQSKRSHRQPNDWRLLSKILDLSRRFSLTNPFRSTTTDHSRAPAPGAPALASTWVVPYAVLALILLWRFRRFLDNLPSNGITVAAIRGRLHRRCSGMEMIGSFAVRSKLIRCIAPGMAPSLAWRKRWSWLASFFSSMHCCERCSINATALISPCVWDLIQTATEPKKTARRAVEGTIEPCNQRALPRGRTSSGKTKFSCGWSAGAIQARRPSFRRMFLV